ncbi:MAG: electron transfer flavoprotein subunit beta/FixA family protein [Thermodesulfobacteriota bacterium]|nr:electron transfer flavoprotein subunit beta/FixA family protein [Thermodesulfobacteriota bacterium]
MAYRMICLVKRVVDARNITPDLLKEDGTVDRQALPSVFNPDDLHALEMALGVKDRYGGDITVISMGRALAVEVLKDALCRGADRAILLTDKRFGGADTLATSQVLERAVRKNGPFDLIFCGRQAIGGDTGQVGPQVAERLNIPQVTCAETIEYLNGDEMVIGRLTDDGHERIRGSMPMLITVTDSAARPRPPSAKRLMFWKKGETALSVEDVEERDRLGKRGLLIPVWNLEALGCPAQTCGNRGSATWIKSVESVKLTPREQRRFDASEHGIKGLISELIDEHII